MDLRLSFDRADKVYSAGDIVKCSLHLKVTKEVQCRSISMRFLGIGTTEFETHDITRKRCRKIVSSKTYSGYEEYFRHYKYFIGSKGALETCIIPGSYEFFESYELPPNIPANLDGDYGSIKYLVRVKVENNWTQDQLIVDTFAVKPVLNLIQQSDRVTMIEQRNQKYFHSWWMHKKSKPVEITATLMSGVFVIGDTVQLSVAVNNQSNIQIKHFLIKLEQCITFKGSLARQEDELDQLNNSNMKTAVKKTDQRDAVELSEIQSDRVLWTKLFSVPVQTMQKSDFIAEIPLPTENHIKLVPGSRLIQSEHFIRLTGVVSRLHSDPELIIRFKIATTASDV